MSTPQSAQQSWQSSVTTPSLPSLEQVRAGADTFHRKIRRRNRIEYIAAVVVVIAFTAYVFFLPNPVARVGAALVVIGTLYLVWQLHRRASAVATPEQAGLSSILAHQRAQLVRQRDALASIFWWYLLPLLPGMTLMISAPIIMADPVTLHRPPVAGWFTLALCIVVFVGIWWLNQRVARKLQKAIDDLDALGDGDP